MCSIRSIPPRMKLYSCHPPCHTQAKPDYDAVRAAIADVMDKDGYDDGSYGMLPVLWV